MSTAETVKAQLQADIAAANEVTGKQDATMHDAVASLIEGFGGGGGGGVGKLICDTVIDVPESDVALDITLDSTETKNKEGNVYIVMFDFLDELPVDDFNKGFKGVSICVGLANPHYSATRVNTCVASVLNGIKRSHNDYLNPTYVPKVSNMGVFCDMKISVSADNVTNKRGTCRGRWRVRCYLVNEWEG